MKFLKKHGIKIGIAAAVVLVLAAAFFLGDSVTERKPAASDRHVPQNTSERYDKETEEKSGEEISDKDTDKTDKDVLREETQDVVQNTSHEEENQNNRNQNENYHTENGEYTEDNKIIVQEDNRLICTISIRCDNAIGRSNQTNPVILPEKEVEFNEGQTVFDVLLKATKENKIHMEFVNTPIYNSAYIEGINNLYEFDCGDLSGWMYKVNGSFPNFGCSQYVLKKGDKIEWVYTLDLGKDVGGGYSARNGME